MELDTREVRLFGAIAEPNLPNLRAIRGTGKPDGVSPFTICGNRLSEHSKETRTALITFLFLTDLSLLSSLYKEKFDRPELKAKLHPHASPRKAARRSKLSDPASVILTKWLRTHSGRPYPSKAEKEGLARDCKLTQQQVDDWFINRRRTTRMTINRSISSYI
ncbi:uncharacterized protein V1518DRAFT_121005 [Limtongia smithiae]|uniref:uncharacterized protein n=1 Tax=Limtongia smithiae TaxID=1125753 RepID=UPI0034CE5399